MRRPAKKKFRPLRALLFFLGGGMLAIVIGYFAVTAWLQNYLRSDALRGMLAGTIGNAAHAHCELEPISWSGWNAYSAKVTLQSAGTADWDRIEAQSLQASLDWSGVRRGVWHVPSIDLDWLRVAMADGTRRDVAVGGTASPSPGAEAIAPDPGAPAWVRRWLPTRTEIDGVDVRKFDLTPAVPGAGVAVEAVHLRARPTADEGAWKINGEDGRLLIPGVAEPFRLGGATARCTTGAFVLHDATARWLGDSEVTARGEIPFAGERGWSFSGRVNGLDLRHVLAPVWVPKIGGVVDGDYDITGRSGAAVVHKGKLRVKSGVVQALPLLDRVADFTHTARFRRIVLDVATGDVEVRGARTRVTNLALQSNGLIRVEGEVLIEGRNLQGNLRVGVSPETLLWMPGAQNHVFTEANAGNVPGFVWTRVCLSGTMDSPREDLSSRLLAAMGRAVLVDAPMEVLETGVNVLGTSGGAAAQGGKAVLDGSGEVLKGAGEAAGQGIEILKGFVPLLPK